MEFTGKTSSNQGDNAIKEKKLFSLSEMQNDRIPFSGWWMGYDQKIRSAAYR
jgi:hypothetical protein